MAKKSKKAINGAIQDALNETLENSEIKAAISDALQTELLEVVREYGQKSVEEKVYKVYAPEIYERRCEDGGLSDLENWVVSSVNINKLGVSFRNVTEPKPGQVDEDSGELTAEYSINKDLSYLIVSGYSAYPHYDYPRPGRKYMQPRDFVTATANKLRAHPFETHEAVAKGLIRHGLTVDLAG